MPKRSLIIFTSVSIVIASLTRLASAEGALSPDIKISWTAPSGCPNEVSVRGSIASLLRAEAVKSRPGAPTFEAVVRHADDRFDLTVRLRSPSGQEEKVIHGETCSTVADAFALVVAFAIDPNLAGRDGAAATPVPEMTANEPPATETPATAVVRSRVVPPSPLPQSEPLPFGIGVVGSAAAGTLPFPGLGLGGVVALGRRPRWELQASYWPNRRTNPPLSSGRVALVDVRLFTVRPSACFPILRESRVELCSSLEVGRMAADSSGVSDERSGLSWWLAPAAGVALDVPVARAAFVRVRLDVGVPLLRPNFVIGPSEQPAWQPAAVFGILSLEPELRFSPKGDEVPGHIR